MQILDLTIFKTFPQGNNLHNIVLENISSHTVYARIFHMHSSSTRGTDSDMAGDIEKCNLPKKEDNP